MPLIGFVVLVLRSTYIVGAPVDISRQMRLRLQAQRHLEHRSTSGAPLQISQTFAELLGMATIGGSQGYRARSLYLAALRLEKGGTQNDLLRIPLPRPYI